jgi:glycosyltransferase involved in cell wall biosynthesis
MKALKNKNIGIITFPPGKAGITPLSNLIDVLRPNCNDIHLITGNDAYDFMKKKDFNYAYGFYHYTANNFLLRIIKYVILQFKIAFLVFKLSKNVDIWIFFLTSELLIPMVVAKLCRTPVLQILTSSLINQMIATNDKFRYFMKYLATMNHYLSNYIIVYSSKLIDEWNLSSYKNKIWVLHRHFVDFDKFKITKEYNKRCNLIGYVGRLSNEKGVCNFLKSIKLISDMDIGFKFIIIGEGQLQEKISSYIKINNLDDIVKLESWVNHEELPNILNKFKLIVIPSYTEGLPNIMLEAMACGTPVLANKIGAIPDYIQDGKTGFLMENNTPKNIEKKIIHSVKYDKIDKIIENADKIIKKEFSYEHVVEEWAMFLKKIL